MRRQVLGNNVYLWGARLIEELSAVRLGEAGEQAEQGPGAV